MAWILLTNDDGVDSPALVPLARALSGLCEVRVVVPDRERSWVGKAITRFDAVDVIRGERDGFEVWTCNGYPADAVQLGVHALFPDPPTLVVSGINLGYNHGAGFLWSSGTVGAAVEGWVSGIPAIAISTGTAGIWSEWRHWVTTDGARKSWERLAGFSARLTSELDAAGLLDLADVVSVNMPFESDERTPRRITGIARTGYDRLFQPEGDGGRFVHAFGGGLVDRGDRQPAEADAGTDVDAARNGLVSITAIRMPEAAVVPPEMRAQVEIGATDGG